MFILFFLIWLILWSRVTLEILLIGALLSGAVYWFACRHMAYDPRTDWKLIKKSASALLYIVLLVWETIKANSQVSRIVFAKEINIEPRIIFFKTKLRTKTAQVVLANSITLTPGTITVVLQDGLFCVHCLNRQMAEGIADSPLVRRLEKLEKWSDTPS